MARYPLAALALLAAPCAAADSLMVMPDGVSESTMCSNAACADNNLPYVLTKPPAGSWLLHPRYASELILPSPVPRATRPPFVICK